MARVLNHFYRFRSVKALLGPYGTALGQFDELERQEIYFAKPSELNDPMEGFKNLIWQGDEIVWRNLLRHYLHCLMVSSYLCAVAGEDFKASLCGRIIHQTFDDLPKAPVREIYHKICAAFFAHEVPNKLVVALGSCAWAVRRHELVSYLRSLHPMAASLVRDAISRVGENHGASIPSDKGNAFIDGPLEYLGKLLDQKVPSAGVRDAMFIASEHTIKQLHLIYDFDHVRSAEQEGWMFLARDFPAYYVDSLERLVYPDWHAACFVANPCNTSVWATYGDAHRGVCLKFFASADGEGGPALSLYRAHAWSGNSNGGLKAHYTYVPHRFEEMRYASEYPEINFFGSLGTVPMQKVTNFWYAGADGAVSTSKEKISKDEEDWRRRYWDTFRQISTSKTREWAHEREYRLILTSNLERFDDPVSRKLKYRFSDLAGIAFGIKTSTEDKLRIMKVIKEKCRAEGRTDFEFLEARYSPSAHRVELQPLSLLKIEPSMVAARHEQVNA